MTEQLESWLMGKTQPATGRPRRRVFGARASTTLRPLKLVQSWSCGSTERQHEGRCAPALSHGDGDGGRGKRMRESDGHRAGSQRSAQEKVRAGMNEEGS